MAIQEVVCMRIFLRKETTLGLGLCSTETHKLSLLNCGTMCNLRHSNGYSRSGLYENFSEEGNNEF